MSDLSHIPDKAVIAASEAVKLMTEACDAAPHRLYGPLAALVQDALAQPQNVASLAANTYVNVIPGGVAERQIRDGVALAKAVLATPSPAALPVLNTARATCDEPMPVEGNAEEAQTCDYPAIPGTDRCPVHDPRHQRYIDSLTDEVRHLRQLLDERDAFDRERASVLNTADAARPRLASGDISITERTPHGVWIADGPDPDRDPALPVCGGLRVCDDCIAYDALRQHLVEQITLLDEQRQRETAELRASQNSAIAAELNVFASSFAEGRDALAAAGCPGESAVLGGCAKALRARAASLRGEQGE